MDSFSITKSVDQDISTPLWFLIPFGLFVQMLLLVTVSCTTGFRIKIIFVKFYFSPNTLNFSVDQYPYGAWFGQL